MATGKKIKDQPKKSAEDKIEKVTKKKTKPTDRNEKLEKEVRDLKKLVIQLAKAHNELVDSQEPGEISVKSVKATKDGSRDKNKKNFLTKIPKIGFLFEEL